MSERKTEKLVLDQLTALGYTDANGILVEAQKSDSVDITRLLKGASKTGKGGKGAPEFIVTSTGYLDLVLVVECKASVAAHESPGLDLPVDFAVDGAIHHAKHLAKRYNVIAIADSGQTKKELKVSGYLVSKGSPEAKPLVTFSNQPVVELEPLKTLHDYASRDPEVEKRRVTDLMAFARDLHNFMGDYA